MPPMIKVLLPLWTSRSFLLTTFGGAIAGLGDAGLGDAGFGVDAIRTGLEGTNFGFGG